MKKYTVSDIHFRLAELKDVPDLNRFVNGAYRGDSSKSGWTTESDLLGGQRVDFDGLAELIEARQSFILCAFDSHDDQKLISCVHLKKEKSSCYLGMLTVSPLLQNSGLGQLMLNESESRAKNWDCDEIYMTVISVREELISWYIRRGYQLTGEKKPFPYGDARFGLPKRQDLEFVVLNKKI